MTIAVMAPPYPPYDKNYSMYDGAGFDRFVDNTVFHQNTPSAPILPNRIGTPYVVPPTPMKKNE